MTFVPSQAWHDFLAGYPNAHILQSAAWGALKSDFGWQAVYVIVGDCGAQVLFRPLPLGFSLAYIPRGPVGAGWDKLWPEVDTLCKSRRAVFLKVEPDLWEGESDSLSGGAPPLGFALSPHEVQPPRTLIVDLQATEDQILARMKQKTRYNIRLAQRKGVVIRQTNDIESFHELMEITAERDTFGVHSRAYYQRALDLFAPGGHCALLVAEFQEQPLAGLMVFARGRRAWYFYGASSSEQRHLMPTYLLQWKAMQWAKEQGCTQYDLWGIPDEDQETLEASFRERSDGLWGVYRFKRGFGGGLRRTVQAWDRVYIPWFYKLYLWRMAQKSSTLL